MTLTDKINAVVERFNNQTFYSESVGTYLLNLQDTIVLFDIPRFDDQTKRYLLNKDKKIVALLSHGPCGIADGTKWQKEIDLQVYMHEADVNSEWLFMKPDILFDDPITIDEQIEIVHTPGHSPGSICLYEKTTKSMLTGDTCGGINGQIRDFTEKGFNEVGYGEFDERLQACRKLLDYDFENLLPFHYDTILGNAKNALKSFLANH